MFRFCEGGAKGARLEYQMFQLVQVNGDSLFHDAVPSGTVGPIFASKLSRTRQRATDVSIKQ
jgi:hypothetical protein